MRKPTASNTTSNTPINNSPTGNRPAVLQRGLFIEAFFAHGFLTGDNNGIRIVNDAVSNGFRQDRFNQFTMRHFGNLI